ncbi:MAG: hypothetical protein ACYS0G_06145 [Planctomycetota bacterium]
MALRNSHLDRGRRRGGTLGGLLATISVIGALSVTTAVIAPRYLAAGVGPPEVAKAKTAVHQEKIDALAGLIGRSVGVMGIHQRGATPFLEIVLWLHDDDDSGRADESELAVLSHSEVLRTITIYRLDEDENDPAVVPLDVSRSAEPDFCDRWRADPRVVPLILITGVSDIRIEPLGTPWEGTQRLRIGLTWAPDSVDGPDEASVVVDAVMFSSDARE